MRKLRIEQCTPRNTDEKKEKRTTSISRFDVQFVMIKFRVNLKCTNDDKLSQLVGEMAKIKRKRKKQLIEEIYEDIKVKSNILKQLINKICIKQSARI